MKKKEIKATWIKKVATKTIRKPNKPSGGEKLSEGPTAARRGVFLNAGRTCSDPQGKEAKKETNVAARRRYNDIAKGGDRTLGREFHQWGCKFNENENSHPKTMRGKAILTQSHSHGGPPLPRGGKKRAGGKVEINR